MILSACISHFQPSYFQQKQKSTQIRVQRNFVCKNERNTRIQAQSVSTEEDIRDRTIEQSDVVIIGGGVAGLACAQKLLKGGLNPVILEASDDIGGRVRTDEVDGFLLDRGFQIFLSSYPISKSILNYDKLDLRPFYAGALVYYNGQFHRVADPFRHLLDSLGTLLNPIGSIKDKLQIGILRLRSFTWDLDEIFTKNETTIVERLEKEGFSREIVDRFFRPFMGGIFFNRDLTTTSRLFEFVMKMLATGQNCFPAAGIGQIAQQMAEKIPKQNIRLGCKVEQISRNSETNSVECTVINPNNETETFSGVRGVVIATEGDVAENLLSTFQITADSKTTKKTEINLNSHKGEPVGTCCLYFHTQQPPSDEPILFLNGEQEGIINNCCIPTNVAKTYSKDSRALISASTVGLCSELSDEELENQTRIQLSKWFGKQNVDLWQHIKTYRIPYAQPCQQPETNLKREVRLDDGLFVCGDHRESATLDGAIDSGMRAADAILKSV